MVHIGDWGADDQAVSQNFNFDLFGYIFPSTGSAGCA